jgi:energy-coupling factor transporter ATP-binding protein EcfA2
MNVIETHGLGKRYRRTWALRDCTLGIPGGHIVALVGPNGAGKTTLLTISVGLTKATEGGGTRGTPRRAWTGWASRCGNASASCPAGRRPSSRSRSRWRATPPCSFSTNRSPRSTRWPGTTS